MAEDMVIVEEAEEVEAAAVTVTVTLREDRVAAEVAVVVVVADKGSAGMPKNQEAALKPTALSATHQVPIIQGLEEAEEWGREWHNLSKIFLRKASSSRTIQTVLGALVGAFKVSNSKILVELVPNKIKNLANLVTTATNSNKVSALSTTQFRWAHPKCHISQLARQHKFSNLALDSNNSTLMEVLATNSAADSATL